MTMLFILKEMGDALLKDVNVKNITHENYEFFSMLRLS